LDIVKKDIKLIVRRLNEDGIKFENKTVLVTGGAGFLGSWICDVLIKQKSKVICLDNFSSGRRDNVEHLEIFENFRLVEHDISESIFFNEHIDLILHLASRASPLEFSLFPIQILKANTFGTWVTLEIAKKHKARLVFASSSEVYGDPDPKNIPTPESYFGNVNPIGVRSCYDEAKRVAEAFVMGYNAQFGVDTRIVRIHNTYGPRMRADGVYGRVVTRFIDQALSGAPLTVFGDGMQTRSFTYITDMIYGILKMSYFPSMSGEIVNLGSTKEIHIIELAKTVLELTASDSLIELYPLPPDDPKRRCPDISKAERFLKWKPEISLKEGLIKTISWLKDKKLYH